MIGFKLSFMENLLDITNLKIIFSLAAISLALSISFSLYEKTIYCQIGLFFNKEIYIFDEPTSNLDGKSEEKVVKNILKYLNKKIVIFITHNKKNYKFFDKIVNLD